MTGAERIAAERKRQIEVEGWTPEHDEKHKCGELPIAAACYATYGTASRAEDISGTDAWPFDGVWDKREKHSRIHQLEIAGALIAAEIDRLLRLEGN